MITKVESTKAPKAIGPYSQALTISIHQRLIFVSGQLPLDPDTGELIQGDIRTQTQAILNTIEAILHEAGSDFKHVVRVEIFLTDLKNFAIVNEEYAKKINVNTPPARQTIEVSALPKGANIEISCIAISRL